MIRYLTIIAIALCLSSCAGSQSAFSPAGPDAGRIYVLTIVMVVGAAIIFLGVMAMAAAAILGPARWRAALSSDRLVFHGGVVFTSVVLTALLAYGLFVMRAGHGAPAQAETAASATAAPLRIDVVGEQWWWRVIYRDEDGAAVETANELHIPTGRPIELSLTSADVIHSFWVPAYAGKVDMVPGRTNTLTFSVDKPGLVRGQCAEYCGGPHALMSFQMIAQAPDDFAAWLENERAPVAQNGGDGRRLFLERGCGACHAVRGTPADGAVGPDLTHLGGREMIGAAVLPNTPATLADWIGAHQKIKPDNLMPPYDFLSDDERMAIADWLSGLE